MQDMHEICSVGGVQCGWSAVWVECSVGGVQCGWSAVWVGGVQCGWSAVRTCSLSMVPAGGPEVGGMGNSQTMGKATLVLPPWRSGEGREGGRGEGWDRFGRIGKG